MNKKIKKILSWTGIIVLLLVSLALIFNEQIKTALIETYKPTISRTEIQQNENKQGDYDFNKVRSLDFQTVAKTRARGNKDIHVIGELSIPATKLTLPIGQGISNSTLAVAAGTMRPDMKMGEGNYALAGHHMIKKDVLFSPLYNRAKVGQKVYLSDLSYIYEYQITTKKIISAYQVDTVENTPGQNVITMITCDSPTATTDQRLMVRGNFIRKMKFNKASKAVQKSFSKGFNNKDVYKGY